MTASLLQRPDYPEWDWCDFDSNAENSLRTHREPSAMVLVATGTIHGDWEKAVQNAERINILGCF